MIDKIEACAAILYDAAIERTQENPELARADFETFCDVMWTDDADIKRAGLTRGGISKSRCKAPGSKCRSRSPLRKTE